MKVLKSGIEIEPRDLNKIRGAACACGCGIGYDGEQLVVSGDADSLCSCGCITPPEWNNFSGNSSGGLKIIMPK